MSGAVADSGAAKTFAGDTVKETCDSKGNYNVLRCMLKVSNAQGCCVFVLVYTLMCVGERSYQNILPPRRSSWNYIPVKG